MKIRDYEALLLTVSQALEVCEQSEGFTDQKQRELCDDLCAIRARLLDLILEAESRSAALGEGHSDAEGN